MTLTKNDLVQLVLQDSNLKLKRAQAIKFVEDFLEIIISGLESGDDVRIAGFGNFTLHDKKARIGRNPKTKEEYPIAARRVVSFRASSVLKTALKNHQNNDD